MHPVPLQMSIVNAIMVAALLSIHDVNYVPIEATSELTTGDRHIYSRLIDCNYHWKDARHAMFTKKTVLLFASNSHYTSTAVQLLLRTFAYFDGLNTDPKACPWEFLMVQQLYTDEALRQGLQPHQDDWAILYPTQWMQRQQPYIDDSIPQAQPQHIDCGLYAILMTMLYRLNIPLSLLTPMQVHRFRQYTAYQIIQDTPLIDISSFYIPYQ